jgi:hypothetical protein
LKSKYINNFTTQITRPIFKTKQTKDKIKLDINIAAMHEAKLTKLHQAIEKLIAEFDQE